MIETLKDPIIEFGKNLLGVEIIENYNEGADQIDGFRDSLYTDHFFYTLEK
jgi:hypothetical protein